MSSKFNLFPKPLQGRVIVIRAPFMKVWCILILAGSSCLLGADGGLTITGAPTDSVATSTDTVVFTLPGKPRTVAPEPAAPAGPELPPPPELPKVVLPDAFVTD